MKQFFERLWFRKSSRPASARRPTARLQLEALETRLTPSATAVQTAVLKTDGELDLYSPQTGTFQVLSAAGTIGSVSASQNASGQTVVYAIAVGPDGLGHINTLWEHRTDNPGGWTELSTGSFQQVSAATDVNGNAVAFAVLGPGAGDNASMLLEYNGGWKELAGNGFAFGPSVMPSSVLSVSAVGTVYGEVAFAIANDHSLWQYTPTSPALGWTQVSTGWFQQVSAGLDANGLADAFGVLGQGTFTGYVGSLWQYSKGAWTELSGPNLVVFTPGVSLPFFPQPPIPPSQFLSATAGLNGEVFAVGPQGGVFGAARTLWEYGPSVETELSNGSFAQVSASQTPSGADEVFGTLTDGSLWEYTNGGWTELLTGGVAATATPFPNQAAQSFLIHVPVITGP
jgi:hypothetical protein